MPDGSVLDDSIRSKFPTVNQYDEGITFNEIKIANHFRNFTFPRILYGFNSKDVETQIPILKTRKEIFNTLKEINNK